MLLATSDEPGCNQVITSSPPTTDVPEFRSGQNLQIYSSSGGNWKNSSQIMDSQLACL